MVQAKGLSPVCERMWYVIAWWYFVVLLQILHVYSFPFTVTCVAACALLMCMVLAVDHLNSLPHSVHLYGFVWVCVRMWLVKPFDWVNALLHNIHLYGLMLRCVRMCRVSASAWWNALSHALHVCFFSCPCLTLCLLSLSGAANVLLHTSHMYGRSPECTRMCTASWPGYKYALPHSVHKCFLSELRKRLLTNPATLELSDCRLSLHASLLLVVFLDGSWCVCVVRLLFLLLIESEAIAKDSGTTTKIKVEPLFDYSIVTDWQRLLTH